MAKKIILDLDIDSGDSVRTMQQLENELVQLRDELKDVEIGSAAFDKLAGKIQNAASEVKTLEKDMEGLEPLQKAEAFLKMGEGVAGGFLIAQSSIALLGVESEKLAEIQLKVQGLIGIALGARMVTEGILNAAIVKRVISEKIATAATSKYRIVALAATAAQKALNFVMSKNPIALLVKAVGGIVAAYAVFRRSSERTRIRIANGFKSMANAIISGTNAVIDGMNKINPFKAIQRIKEFELEVVPPLENTEEKVKEVKNEVVKLGDEADETKRKMIEMVQLMERFGTKVKDLSELETQTSNDVVDTLQRNFQRRQDLIDDTVKHAELSLNLLSGLNDAFSARGDKSSRKQFERQKKIDIAAAIVSTYAAANKAWNDETLPSTVARGIAAAGVIAAGLANVKTIKQTKFGGGEPTGARGAGLDTIAAATPADLADTGGTGNADIAAAALVRATEPIKAFVVAQEVTDMQQVNEEIRIQSSL